MGICRAERVIIKRVNKKVYDIRPCTSAKTFVYTKSTSPIETRARKIIFAAEIVFLKS